MECAAGQDHDERRPEEQGGFRGSKVGYGNDKVFLYDLCGRFEASSSVDSVAKEEDAGERVADGESEGRQGGQQGFGDR